jgi:hypothetical protein
MKTSETRSFQEALLDNKYHPTNKCAQHGSQWERERCDFHQIDRPLPSVTTHLFVGWYLLSNKASWKDLVSLVFIAVPNVSVIVPEHLLQPYCSWINNYLCNQCLSPLMLQVRILITETFGTAMKTSETRSFRRLYWTTNTTLQTSAW